MSVGFWINSRAPSSSTRSRSASLEDELKTTTGICMRFPSLQQRRAGDARNVQIQDDERGPKMSVAQHGHGLFAIPGDVEVHRDGDIRQDLAD